MALSVAGDPGEFKLQLELGLRLIVLWLGRTLYSGVWCCWEQGMQGRRVLHSWLQMVT